MKRNIKYGVSIFTLVLSLTMGYLAYAAGNPNVDEKVGGPGAPLNLNGDNQLNPLMEQNKERRGEFKDEVGVIKDDLKANREQYRIELEQMIQSIKEKRQTFKIEMQNSREEAKTKMTEMKKGLKEQLVNIKDENKKMSTEKIVDLIQELNVKITDNLSDKVDQIENVLVSVESRISKAKDRGIDVSSLTSKVETAKEAITKAREAIKTQADKVYEIKITNETTLKTEMKTLRDTFSKDIKALHQIVKDAHVAVKNVAVSLAQIPNVDVDDEVEDNNTTNND